MCCCCDWFYFLLLFLVRLCFLSSGLICGLCLVKLWNSFIVLMLLFLESRVLWKWLLFLWFRLLFLWNYFWVLVLSILD